ncbi:MAG: hypothetical protein E7E21_00830 [Peptostreptococcaceae bacterium]|nr:hypothetical protein [Peptostreptococcaceae bacterium]
MFCKIRKGKETYSIYICERYRENGKVVSKDKKICTYGYHSLYDDFEDYNPNFNELPKILEMSLTKRILKIYTVELYDDLECKLLKLKKEYYPKYEQLCRKIDLKWAEEKAQREEKYNEFKEQYRDLYYKEISAKYQEGYLNGQLSSANFGSGNSLDIDSQEKSLLKEAFKLLSHKYHPDKGGCTDKMASINNLKEKIL